MSYRMSDDPRYWDHPDYTEYTLEELIKAKEECINKQILHYRNYINIPNKSIDKDRYWKLYCSQIYKESFIKEELEKRFPS